MMIARWHCEARFGHKQEALSLVKEWQEKIGSQTVIGDDARILTGSVGAREATIEIDHEIDDLAQLQEFFDKIATIRMHQEWGKRMGEVIVSGSTYWEVFRIVD